MENNQIQDIFIGVIVNDKDEYFRSFSYHGGNSWTTDIKKAKIFTKIGPARTRATLITNWNERKEIEMEIPKIRQYEIIGYIDIDQTERIAIAKEKEAKHKLVSETNLAIWRQKQAQQEYDKAKAELDRLAKLIQ